MSSVGILWYIYLVANTTVLEWVLVVPYISTIYGQAVFKHIDVEYIAPRKIFWTQWTTIPPLNVAVINDLTDNLSSVRRQAQARLTRAHEM